MKQLLFSMAAILFVFAASAQTVRIPIQGETTKMKIESNNGLSFTAVLNISEFTLTKVETPSGYFTVVDLPQFTKRFDDGRPAIPLFSKLIETPTRGPASISNISYNIAEFDLDDLGFSDKVIPAQPSWSKNTDPSEIIFHYDQAFYGINSFSNNQLIRIVEGGEMRGVNMGTVVIDPISYNPVSNKIEIKYNIRFTVNFDPIGYAQYNQRKANFFSPAHDGFYKELANYIEPATKDIITTYPIKFVIVADRMFETALQPFIQWKTEKGFTVIEAYTDQSAVGTTTTSIKSYLQGLYDAGTPTDPSPTYVLFVGDVAQIPAFNGASMNSHVTDLYYACYGGSTDNIPDIYYGRFSAQTVAQLTPQINKTLMYEKFTMPSANYMDTVLMIAGVDGTYAPTYGNGQISYGTNNYFNAAHGIYSHTYLYPASDGTSVPSEIINIIGDGVGYANYTAHCSTTGWGDPSFTTTGIASLNNANKYGLIVGNCCQSVKFEDSNCFGEAILRAENEGAVGYIGASDYSYWDGDYWWGIGNTSSITSNPTYAGSGLGAYDKAFHDNGEATSEWFISNGQMVVGGNIAVQASTYSTTFKKYYWEEYHLMGDPSVMNYFSKPDPLTISYDNPAQVGNTSLVVNTEAYTYVAISLNGVLLDAQYTGTNTSVTLTFPAFTSVDTALVVATKQNKIPHIGDLPIEDVSVTLDAQVLSILKPTGSYACTNISETPRIVIKNRGINNLTSTTIKYKLNNGTLQTASWTGNLATNESDTFDLTTITIPAGTNTFLAYTINPNGGTDMNIANDSASITFVAEDLPIVAAFTASSTAFCSAPANITLDNTSTNASSYFWDFGDGTTSTLAEPTHTYTSVGLYTVSLTANGGVCGSDSYDITVMVGSQPPVINDTTACGAQSFVLNAGGSNINWYSDATGTTQIGSGNTYTTPVITNTQTFYLNSASSSQYTGGKPDNSGTGGYFTNTNLHGIVFNCTSPVTLKTVVLYSDDANSKTITLTDASDNVIDQATVSVISGENTVTLNIDIPVGNGLKLMGPASPNLYRNGSTTGPNLYPYSVGPYIELIGSTASGYETQYYYYFYNWVVEENCTSAMESVTCTILPVPVADFSATTTNTCENTTITLTDATSGSPNAWIWSITPTTYSFVGGTSAASQNPQIQFTAPGTYNVQLTATNNCGSDIESKNNLITVATPPAQPSAIAGNATPCANTTGLTYNVTNVGGVSYNWTVPTGWSITSGNGTNTITVDAGANAGTITVTPNNGCEGTPQALAVAINTAPDQPSAINGQIGPCQAGSETYFVTNVPGVTYTWSVPADWIINSGQNTSSITTTIGTQSGNITVTPSNACGNGTAQILNVTSSLMPNQPSAIFGDNTPCQTSQTYTVSAESGITYTWSFPTGWNILSGQGSNSITVIPSNTAGVISVIPSNGCGAGTAQTMNATPEEMAEQPSAIAGTTTPCSFTTQTYSVTNVTGITYTWTLPSGWAVNTGQGTNSITVTTGNTNGTITVTPSNACGSGTPQTLDVSSAAYPLVDLGADTSICEDQILILDAGNSGSNYLWSNGATSQTITIDASLLTPGNGYNYQVTVTNSSGCASTDAISVNILICSGIDDNFETVTAIFPNPAQDNITVTCANSIQRIEILDTKGAVVYNQNFSGNVLNINVAALSEGLYYIRVTTASGSDVLPLTIDK